MITRSLLKILCLQNSIGFKCTCHCRRLLSSARPRISFLTDRRQKQFERQKEEESLSQWQKPFQTNFFQLGDIADSDSVETTSDAQQLISIPLGYSNVDTWDDIVKSAMNRMEMTRNCAQMNIMQFLVKNCFDKSCRDSSSNSEVNAVTESFLDYLFNSTEALEVGQSAICEYLITCDNPKKINLILLQLKSRVKVFGAKLLMEILKTEIPDSKNKEELVKFFGLHATISSASLIRRAGVVFLLKHNEKLMAVRLMRDMVDFDEEINHSLHYREITKTFLETFSYTEDEEQWAKNRQVVEYFFLYSSFYNFQYKPTILIDWFKNIKNETWKAETFSVNEIRKKQCPITGVALTPSVLTAKEHQTLFEGINTLLLKQQVGPLYASAMSELDPAMNWINEKPQYLIKDFLEMLKQEGPFDLVLDGLNLYFTCKTKEMAVKAIKQGILDYRAKKKNAKVLLVGRKHLSSAFQGACEDFFDSVHTFYVDSNVEDDSFLLCAALHSGKDCWFMSNDMYRNYRYYINLHLGRKMSKLFHKFQVSRQITFRLNHVQSFVFEYGSNIYAEMQCSPTVWHVPYFREDQDDVPIRAGEPPCHFLCIHRTDVKEP